MDILSKRIKNMAESATIAMAQKARELKEQGNNVISLSLGEPDFKTPKHIQEAAKTAIDEGKWFAYPPVPGYSDLRQAIANKLNSQNNVPCKLDNIVVSSGAKHAIANIFLSVLNDGDEVIIYSPYWVSYPEMIRLAGGVPKFVQGTISNNFKPPAEELENAITPKTKAIIFSSPCNPTGSVFSKRELEHIAEVVKKHGNILVIADEIYEYINYTKEGHFSIASIPGMAERTALVNGFSKGYAMTGWRVGYIAAPVWLAKSCTKLQGQVTSGICSIAQRAALAGTTESLYSTYEMTKTYAKRRELILSLLKGIPGLKSNNPEGAFYVFPDVSAFFGKSDGKNLMKTAHDISMYILQKAHVSTVGGDSFGNKDCIRISYAASDENIKEALKRIKKVLVELR